MSPQVSAQQRISTLIEREPMTPELLARLVALASVQAHIAASEIGETVIPALPAVRRSFAMNIAARAERGAIFEEGFLRDLETFNASVSEHVRGETQTYWHNDENHISGGYELPCNEGVTSQLATALWQLEMLADLVLAVLSSSRALRETDGLLGG